MNTPPDTMMLGYLTAAIATPTRVRHAARVGVLIGTCCTLLLVALMVARLFYRAMDISRSGAPWFGPYGVEEELLGHPFLYLSLILLLFAFMGFLSAAMLQRGKKGAGGVGCVALYPVLIFLFIGAAVGLIAPAFWTAHPIISGFIGIPSGLLLGFLSLLCLDIMRCLKWVEKTPSEEMPPVPFV